MPKRRAKKPQPKLRMINFKSGGIEEQVEPLIIRDVKKKTHIKPFMMPEAIAKRREEKAAMDPRKRRIITKEGLLEDCTGVDIR